MPMTLEDLTKQGYTITPDGKVVRRESAPKTAARPLKAAPASQPSAPAVPKPARVPQSSRLTWWFAAWALFWGLPLLAWSPIATAIYWAILALGGLEARRKPVDVSLKAKKRL